MIEAAWMAFGFLGGLITGVLLVKRKAVQKRGRVKLAPTAPKAARLKLVKRVNKADGSPL